jgi:hypothetical protein
MPEKQSKNLGNHDQLLHNLFNSVQLFDIYWPHAIREGSFLVKSGILRQTERSLRFLMKPSM